MKTTEYYSLYPIKNDIKKSGYLSWLEAGAYERHNFFIIQKHDRPSERVPRLSKKRNFDYE